MRPPINNPTSAPGFVEPTAGVAGGSHQRMVSQHLEQSGWRKYQSLGREIWCKRWKDATRCKCNENQPGIQVVITVHEYEGRHSYEIDVTGEKPDGVWVKLSAYSFNAEEIIQASETQSSQLVAAWNLLANDQAQRPALGGK